MRIALAGRSLTRLRDVAADLGPAAEGWPLLVVDATDEEAVTDLAGRAAVVVTTVGPYVKYGVPLAAACAEAGTHYCDLTGEVLFVHRSIAANHEAAQRTGARIIHACGFDSIPSDLGVWLTAQAARADGAELGRTHLAVRSLKGGFSGGTIDSARTQVEELRGDYVRPPRGRRPVGPRGGRVTARPRPAGARHPMRSRRAAVWVVSLDTVTKASPVRRDADNGHFTGPFVMAAFNTRIVARSASLLGYGDGFPIRRVHRLRRRAAWGPSPPEGLGGAGRRAGRARVRSDEGGCSTACRPSPAKGPSVEAQEKGRLRWTSPRRRRTAPGTGPRWPCRTTPATAEPPCTSGQAALSLVEDGDQLPDAAGVLTPATALGAPLVDRLRAHRFTLETERLPG